jgi:choline dehydrogenase-like flavoprotein
MSPQTPAATLEEVSKEEAADTLWDAVVVGTGMGGSTTGYALARAGWHVLFIEKGRFLQTEDAGAATPDGDDAELRLSQGWWPHRLHGTTSSGDLEFHAPLGCGTGGSTLLFAAGLERFSPLDFAPRGNHPTAVDSTLPARWPVGYDELRPFYERAETLYRVRGTVDPLAPDGGSTLLQPPPLSERDAHLETSFRSNGLHPYRIHVGCEHVAGCELCTGVCSRGCKSDAARIALLPALERHGASLLARTEVVRLEADRATVRQVVCRRDGETFRVRGRLVVLAAGAYMSPVILLNSQSESWPRGLANTSDAVGRNLMFHFGDMIAIAPLRRLSAEGPPKSLALNDFYLAEGMKLGTFQAMGVAMNVGQIMHYMRYMAQTDTVWWKKFASPDPVWWRKLSSPIVRATAWAVFHTYRLKYAALWATILEDLPYRHNRVVLDPDRPNGMRFEYRYADELKLRLATSRRLLAQALRPHRMLVIPKETPLNFGHVCGTCRFGDDPVDSVLDRNNRAHGLDNLYVVDASFFPSSGGTNPSLTIAANALRVAEVITARSTAWINERRPGSPSPSPQAVRC